MDGNAAAAYLSPANNIITVNYYFSELEFKNNPPLKIKFSVLQNDFSVSGNMDYWIVGHV